MSGRRSTTITPAARDRGVAVRAKVPLVLSVALAGLLASSSGSAVAAGPSPSPTRCACSINLTGHWASPVDAGGIDIVQAGASLRGHSLSGITFTGTLSGNSVGFTFWRGDSYAKATDENRGTGFMKVAPGGTTLSVTWHSGSGKGVYNGSFVLVKVGPPAENGPVAANMGLVESIGEAVAPLLPPGPSPAPGASPLPPLQQVLDAVTPALDVPQTPVRQAEQNGLRYQMMLLLYTYELDLAILDRLEGKPITPERQAKLNSFYNQVREELDNTAGGVRYPDPPALNTP
jgi:hypothetical protein